MFFVVLPVFVTMLNNVSALAGENVIVDCRATGHPTPDIRWFRGQQLITSNGVLTIQRVNLSHVSDYQCVASNAAGTTTKTIHLSVYSK